MTVEINKTGEIITDKKGKTWLPVLISNVALSQLNKIIIGDEVDPDDRKANALRKQIHEDCLALFKEFN